LAPTLLAGTSRYVVLLRGPMPHGHARVLNESAEHQIREFQTLDAFAANLNEKEIEDLRASGNVLSIETLKERHVNAVEDRRPRLSGQAAPQVIAYGVDLIHARSIWPLSRGENINVVIIDTGIDMAHPDLAANYAGGYNTFNPSGVPLDDFGHGTHVAGIIGALDNNIGVVGVAPKARLWSVKVLNDKGSGDNEHIAAGIDWVIAKKRTDGGNWIVNMSFGGDQLSEIEQAAMTRAADEGILLVAAAGNRAWPYSDFPAAFPNVMAVSAIDADKKLAPFTSGGDTLSVAAPGVNVLSTVPVGSAIISDIRASSGALFAAAPLF